MPQVGAADEVDLVVWWGIEDSGDDLVTETATDEGAEKPAEAVALLKMEPGVVQGQTVTVDSTVTVLVAIVSEKRPVARRAAR